MEAARGDDAPWVRVIETLRQGVVDDHEVESLVEGAPQPMLDLDDAGAVVLANERAGALVDRESLAGAAFSELVAPEDRAAALEKLRVALATGLGPDDLVVRLAASRGPVDSVVTFLPFRARGGERLALLLRETAGEAEISRRERRLARDRKLADLGSLVSEVAHELKSPTAYVANLAELADRKLAALVGASPGVAAALADVRSDLAEIREGANRIRRLLADLQPLARNQPTVRVPVDLAVLVRDATHTFRGSVPATTRVELDLQSTHPVLLDQREMSRVLVNLLRNASEAMGGGGTVRVATRNRECPPTIRVEDDGPGVPAEVEARLFEAFFTTKPDGTGLGLVISRRIVEANGGALRYERAASGGAAFVIEFEVADAR